MRHRYTATFYDGSVEVFEARSDDEAMLLAFDLMDLGDSALEEVRRCEAC